MTPVPLLPSTVLAATQIQRGSPIRGAESGPADPGERLVGRVLTFNGINRSGNAATAWIGRDALISDDELSDRERGESERRA